MCETYRLIAPGNGKVEAVKGRRNLERSNYSTSLVTAKDLLT